MGGSRALSLFQVPLSLSCYPVLFFYYTILRIQSTVLVLRHTAALRELCHCSTEGLITRQRVATPACVPDTAMHTEGYIVQHTHFVHCTTVLTFIQPHHCTGTHHLRALPTVSEYKRILWHSISTYAVRVLYCSTEMHAPSGHYSCVLTHAHFLSTTWTDRLIRIFLTSA